MEKWRDNVGKAEHAIEHVMFASRWLLAPFYLGLAVSILVLLIKFLEELWHIAAHAFSATESEIILGVLALVDLTLTGSLLITLAAGFWSFNEITATLAVMIGLGWAAVTAVFVGIPVVLAVAFNETNLCISCLA